MATPNSRWLFIEKLKLYTAIATINENILEALMRTNVFTPPTSPGRQRVIKRTLCSFWKRSGNAHMTSYFLPECVRACVTSRHVTCPSRRRVHSELGRETVTCWIDDVTNWRIVALQSAVCTMYLTWRRPSHVSPTCHTDARSGPPPLNNSTFRPVVGQRSEVVPFLLQQQRCGIAYQATLHRSRRCRCSTTGWRHTSIKNCECIDLHQKRNT